MHVPRQIWVKAKRFLLYWISNRMLLSNSWCHNENISYETEEVLALNSVKKASADGKRTWGCSKTMRRSPAAGRFWRSYNRMNFGIIIFIVRMIVFKIIYIRSHIRYHVRLASPTSEKQSDEQIKPQDSVYSDQNWNLSNILT